MNIFKAIFKISVKENAKEGILREKGMVCLCLICGVWENMS